MKPTLIESLVSTLTESHFETEKAFQHSVSFSQSARTLRTGKPRVPVRFVLLLLGTLATAFVFSLRVNLSVGIVAMVNTTAVAEVEARNRFLDLNSTLWTPDSDVTFVPLTGDQCLADNLYMTDNGTITKTPPQYERGSLVWSQSVQGLVLGAYYYGYASTQVIGGRLAEKFGGRWLCGIGVLVSAVATLLSPAAAYESVTLIVISRIIIGIFHGFVYSSLYSMFAIWFPKTERATALSMITVGGNVGAALTMPLCSYLSEYGFAGGWPSIYYTTGGSSLVWFAAWMYYTTNRPEEHPQMSIHELNHIQSGADLVKPKKGTKVRAPWGKIVTSPAVWAIAAGKSCGMFGYYTLSTKLPGYLESVLRMPMQKNGLINALVYVAVSVSMASAGPISDYIKRNHNVSLTRLRKVFESIALCGTGLCLAMIPAAGCDETMVTCLLLLAMFMFGCTTGGDIPIVADLAPQFSGTIFGMTNTISVTMGFLAPIVVGVILQDNHRSIHQWSKVFYFSAAMSVLGNLIFCMWASAAPAEWGTVKKHGPKSYKSLGHNKDLEKRGKDNEKRAKISRTQVSQKLFEQSFNPVLLPYEHAKDRC